MNYIRDQLDKFDPARSIPKEWQRLDWNDAQRSVRTHHWFDNGSEKQIDLFEELENRDVFFSDPLDLDFAMLNAFPDAFLAVRSNPTQHDHLAVLGKCHFNPGQYDADEQQLFSAYHSLFKLSSKPAAHLDALGKLTDAQLLASLPPSLNRLADRVKAKLEESPE